MYLYTTVYFAAQFATPSSLLTRVERTARPSLFSQITPVPITSYKSNASNDRAHFRLSPECADLGSIPSQSVAALWCPNWH